MNIKEKLIDILEKKVDKPITEEDIMDLTGIREVKEFKKILKEMENSGDVVKTRKGKYSLPEKLSIIKGVISGNQKGFGFVIPENPEQSDIFVSGENLNGAMHEDKVLARIFRKEDGDKRAEGEIIRIIERGNKDTVGTLEKNKKFGFVIPDDKRMAQDIYVPADKINKGSNGDKVIVRITKWPEKRRNPEGEIIEILGKKDDPGIDILSIIRKFDIWEEFPQNVIEQLKNIPEEVTKEDHKGRIDLRELKMVTIDGSDAKDLDDAVSIEKLEDGYRLGVHIADVCHYVKANTPLDIEAKKRGTSVYLVDRVIPMLPPKLSNGICSLNSGVERLAMSVFMDLNKKAEVTNYQIKPSVININKRMVYEDVTAILEKNDDNLLNEYREYAEDFQLMAELSNKLREKRMLRGSLDFDFDEIKVILDENGKPVDIKKRERTESHRIIEEFMLVCNEVIAEHMYWLKIPFVYRVHEVPDPEKMFSLKEFLYNLGYTIKGINDIHPKTLQEIINKVKGQQEEKVINTVLLRSLQRARYSEENLGHFGLASRFYSHFTSPIRRYPDLIIHRVLKDHMEGRIKKNYDKLNEELSEISNLSSKRERNAEEAERESVDLKMVEYMEDRVGEEFDGIISGIVTYGMFVELDNLIEGFIHASYLVDDYYYLIEKSLTFQGERTGKKYRIGDRVKVRLISVNKETRQIDFELV